ncbi:MAG: cyclophane-forming radical SAM/SPASM peptide maturase GrrM/OscB [Bradyrhizobium sp.]
MLVLQPTPFCNIDCKYCYLSNRSAKGQMSIETIRSVFSNLLSSGLVCEELTVVWHAGEPLVVPVEYYVEAFEEIRQLASPKINVTHCIQTNGMLIDQSWCNFFVQHEVKIGISIDGPQAIHDRNRVTRSGDGTHSQVLAGIRLLKQNKIPFNVITVLTADSLDKAEELYEFYAQEGIESVAFNAEEIEGANRTSSLAGAEHEMRFRNFLRQFWNLNVRHKKIPYIREFKDMLDRIISASEGHEFYNALVDPLAIMSVDYEGNFSTFSPEFLVTASPAYNNFIVGNLRTGHLRDILKFGIYERLSHEVLQGMKICRQSCEYFAICGGGSPVNKFCENGSVISTETMSCRLHMKVVADLAVEICEAAAMSAGGDDPEIRIPVRGGTL